MEFFLLSDGEFELDRNILNEYLEYKHRKFPEKFSGVEVDRSRDDLSKQDASIFDRPPRTAIKYMDIDAYYGIIGTASDASDSSPVSVVVCNKFKIKKIRDEIIAGGRNADLSKDIPQSDVEYRVRSGVGLLLNFAIENDYCIETVE